MGRTRVSADALVKDTGAPDVIVPQAANRPHFAGKPSPGLRGGSIQCCVRVQAGPPRAGARERVRASPGASDAGAAHRAVAPRARRRERRSALAAGAARHHRGLPHTSNWDFVIGMLALLATGLPAQWVGK